MCSGSRRYSAYPTGPPASSNSTASYSPPSQPAIRVASSAAVIGLRCPSSRINCSFMAARAGTSAGVARRYSMPRLLPDRATSHSDEPGPAHPRQVTGGGGRFGRFIMRVRGHDVLATLLGVALIAGALVGAPAEGEEPRKAGTG